MGKFVVRKTNTGVKFDLKATNGQVIATSEVYNSEQACKNGIMLTRLVNSASVSRQETAKLSQQAKATQQSLTVSTVLKALRRMLLKQK